jgi:YHS domain-containing protein
MSTEIGRNVAEERDIWTDPVSHQPVDGTRSKHQSFYAGHMYHFETLVNKQTFDEDPQLWISTAHAGVTSATLSPIGEAT